MTFLELAQQTLEKAHIPMTADGLWAKGEEYGFSRQASTSGKTPAKTVGAQLYVSIRDNPNTPFCIHSKQPTRFALNSWDGKYITKTQCRVTNDSSAMDKERDLHNLLSYFAYNYMNVITRTIDEKTSKGGPGGKNEWLHPDMAGLDKYYIKNFNKSVLSFSRQINQTPVGEMEAVYREKFDSVSSQEEIVEYVSKFTLV